MSGNIATLCPDCGARYGGNAGHCKRCHRTFTSDAAYDRHLVSLVTAGCHSDLSALTTQKGRPLLQWNERRRMWACWSDPAAALWHNAASSRGADCA